MASLKKKDDGEGEGKPSPIKKLIAVMTPGGKEEAEPSAQMQQKNQRTSVVTFAFAIFTACLIIFPGDNLWNWVHRALLGLFGIWIILGPALFTYVSVMTGMNKSKSTVNLKVWVGIFLMMLCSATGYIFGKLRATELHDGFLPFVRYLYNSNTGVGGGVIGGLLGGLLVSGAGEAGARIIVILLLFVTLMLLTGTSLFQLFETLKRPFTAVTGSLLDRGKKDPQDLAAPESTAEEAESIDEQLDFVKKGLGDGSAGGEADPEGGESPRVRFQTLFDLKPESKKMPDFGDSAKAEKDSQKAKTDSKEQKEKKEEESDKKDPKDKDDKGDKNGGSTLQQAFMNAVDKTNISMDDPEIQDSVWFGGLNPFESQEKKDSEAVKNIKKESVAFSGLIEGAGSADLPDPTEEEGKDAVYRFPSVAMLSAGNRRNPAMETEELQSNGRILVETLQSFGIQSKILDISRGPAVTRYEVQPAAGVKISKITNLSDDLAMNLAAVGVRIEAPIPGKAAIGIEVPNKRKTIVRMRELVESNAFQQSKSKLTVALGRDIAGNVMVADLAKMPHLLIAGTTGSGKSVCVNSLIVSTLYKATPEEVRFLMIDPKVVELGIYNGIPHLLVPVVTDPRKAAGALGWAVNEMLDRYQIFAENNVRDLEGYNGIARAANMKRKDGERFPVMPQIVIIIDELSDLMMAAPNEVEDAICRLAQMARAAGMHLVVATQRPSVDVVTGLIKSNIPSRIAFAVSSAVDSRTILDGGGAEKLLGQGDMLFSPVGAAKPVRLQGCFVSDLEIESITSAVKKSKNSEYDEAVQEEIDRNAAAEPSKRGRGQGSASGDAKIEEAIQCVLDAGQASASLLQRRLSLGYARAGRLVDELEDMGIIGQRDGSKPRQVLMTRAQWMERKMSQSE